MAYIAPPSTDLVEVYSSNKDFNAKNHDKSNITENVQKFNNEQVAREHVENIEENLRHVVCDVSSNEEDYHNRRKLENNGVSSIMINTTHPSDRINLNESSKENELRIDDKKFCDTDNSGNTVKKMSNGSLSLIENDSAEETNLDEILNKNVSIADNEYRSASSEYSYIVEHKNNSKVKSLNRILDRKSEEDAQTNENNNFPQLVDMSTVSNHITYKHYHNI